MYAVVEFLENSGTTKAIDLVPSKWITKEDDELFCQYPSENDYDKVNKLTQDLTDAHENWQKFSVNILTFANSYSKGKRRLKRAFKTTDIRSTDDESNQVITPTILSRKTVSKELRTVPSLMTSSLTSSEKDQQEIPDNELTPIFEENNVFDFDSLKNFINKKIDDQTMQLHRFLTSEKKSLQYDIRKYFEEIKNTLINNTNSTANLTSQQTVSDAVTKLSVALPLKTREEFQKLDEELKNDEAKKSALLTLFRVKVYGETTVRGCIGKMATSLLSKDVEEHYSGTGKVMKGVGKLNFSSTQTFQCMKDVVIEKFGDSEECKNFAGKVGRWLSGCKDREHGRKQRSLSI